MPRPQLDHREVVQVSEEQRQDLWQLKVRRDLEGGVEDVQEARVPGCKHCGQLFKADGKADEARAVVIFCDEVVSEAELEDKF
jgi:hypothetical protein